MAADFVLMPFSLARTLMCRALKSPSRTLRSQLLEYLRNYVIPLLEVDPLSSSERTRYQPLTVLEGGTPTLKLTPAARDAVRAFVSATKRVERIEAIHGFDNADVNTSLDRAHNLAACREQERQKMLNIIKEHETGAQPRPCPYTMDDVAALEADMDHFRASMKPWIDEHAKIREEMQRELEEAWQHPIRLVKLLEQPLRDAGLYRMRKHGGWQSVQHWALSYATYIREAISRTSPMPRQPSNARRRQMLGEMQAMSRPIRQRKNLSRHIKTLMCATGIALLHGKTLTIAGCSFAIAIRSIAPSSVRSTELCLTCKCSPCPRYFSHGIVSRTNMLAALPWTISHSRKRPV